MYILHGDISGVETMADMRAGLRPRQPEILSPDDIPKPILTNKERCKRYREQIKQNVSLYERVRAEEVARKRAARKNRTEDQQQEDREASHKRSKAYRERKKVNGQISEKRVTRQDATVLKERKEHARLSQQRRHEKMSHRKKISREEKSQRVHKTVTPNAERRKRSSIPYRWDI